MCLSININVLIMFSDVFCVWCVMFTVVVCFVFDVLYLVMCFMFIDKMQGEIEFLQGAFDSYKTQLHIETTDKWKKKEDDLRLKQDARIQEKIHELSKRNTTYNE